MKVVVAMINDASSNDTFQSDTYDKLEYYDRHGFCPTVLKYQTLTMANDRKGQEDAYIYSSGSFMKLHDNICEYF